MTENAPAPVELEQMEMVPYTGEVLALCDLSFAQLGELLDACREWERAQLAAFKSHVQQEILDRMDARAAAGEEGAWTVRDGAWKLAGDSPSRTEYPLDDLRRALEGLVAEDLVSEEAVSKVIVPSGYKVARRALTQLLKIPGVAERIREVEQPVERPRRVTVTRESQR